MCGPIHMGSIPWESCIFQECFAHLSGSRKADTHTFIVQSHQGVNTGSFGCTLWSGGARDSPVVYNEMNGILNIPMHLPQTKVRVP